jgi:hypothetical protein
MLKINYYYFGQIVGGQTGFTGASNALGPNFPAPILNPRGK